MRKIIAATVLAMTALCGAVRAGTPVTLAELVTAAKAHNAEIEAARQNWQSARSRADREGVWDDPKLIVEYWSIPEGTLDFADAMEKMYGISQMIPFPGKLSLRAKMAGSEADTMRWEYRETERKVLSELRSAFARYYYLARAVETYRQTAELMSGFSSVAQSRYVVGKAAQSEVLRAQAEAEKMNAMAVTLEQEKESMRAELNYLTGKNADEPLGEPAEITGGYGVPEWADLKKMVEANSPEIGKSRSRLARGQWNRKMASAEYWPDFELAFRRKIVDDQWAGSDIMLGVSVPLWFWKQKAGVRESEAALAAAESGEKNAALKELARAKEGYAKLLAAERLARLYESSIVPKSEQAFRVAQSAFSAGRAGFLELLDSVRAYLEFKLEYYQYVSEYQRNLAELEMIAGTALVLDGGGVNR